jgi:D-glycero-D-manno-heptose 1,7-bisphosphate phosphatase
VAKNRRAAPLKRPRAAVFLDRDGVLNKEVSPASAPRRLTMFGWVPGALRLLAARDFELVVVSNQTVVARGLLTPEEMEALNRRLFADIATHGGPRLDHFYYCPHHPSATLSAYRCACDCRKPRPGLLTRAARRLKIDLAGSFMIGDRISDVMAGAAAGCRTILVESGAHRDPPIEGAEGLAPPAPDFQCPTLREAAEWLTSRPSSHP